MSSDKFILPLFYKRFMSSTQHWTDEEVGAYLRLLIYQWDNGTLPTEFSRLTRIADSAERHWPLLSKKFPEGKNKVMEDIREERVKFVERQRLNGARGGRPRKQELETQNEPKENPTLSKNEPKENPNETQPFPILQKKIGGEKTQTKPNPFKNETQTKPNSEPKTNPNETLCSSSLSINNNLLENNNLDINKENTQPELFEKEITFEKFWDLYDKKDERQDCEKIWAKLSAKEKIEIMENAFFYEQGTRENNAQFRLKPKKFLKGKWKDATPQRIINEVKNLNQNTSWEQAAQE